MPKIRLAVRFRPFWRDAHFTLPLSGFLVNVGIGALWCWRTLSFGLVLTLGGAISTLLLIISCTTSSLTSLFLLSLTPSSPNAPFIEARTSYFRICISTHDVPEAREWVCSSDLDALSRSFGTVDVSTSILELSGRFRGRVLFVGIPILTLILLLTSIVLYTLFPALLHLRSSQTRGSFTSSARSLTPSTHDQTPREKLSRALARDARAKPFPPAAFLVLGVACFVSLVTTVWQHVAAVSTQRTIQDMGAAIAGAEAGHRIIFPGPGLGVQGTIDAAVGRRAIALGWGATVMVCLAEILFWVGILAAEKLDVLLDE